MNLFSELKRRNVLKVAAAYIVTSWLVAQVAELAADSFEAPGWVMKMFITLLALGLPFAVIFAWAFEMTPDGLRKEKEVDRAQSITSVTGARLNRNITIVLVLALAYFAFDKFVLDPKRDAELVQETQSFVEQNTPSSLDTSDAEDSNSIAVLPFVNMSDDGANEYFSDGLSEELLNLLVKIPELKVAARTSSFQFKGKTGDIASIASQLKVANVLEGSVRKSGTQVRITAQLIKADDGYHLWSETYDRTLENIFQVQDEIAAAVVDALKITLLGEAPATKEVDPDAYALYLKGRYYFTQNIDEPSSRKSVEAYEKALEIDPDYAQALAGLALTIAWQVGFEHVDYETGLAKAQALAIRAVQVDPELALAWVSLSDIQGYRWDWHASYESAQKAVELDPGNSVALERLAQITRDLGKFDQSLLVFQSAVELDPLNLSAILSLARAYALTGSFEQARQQYRNLLALRPDYGRIYSQYAYTLALEGRYQDALEQADKDDNIIWRTLLRSIALFSLGRHDESDAELKSFIEANQDFWAYQIAEAYAWRNDADEAFKWLAAAFAYRDPGLSNLLSDRTLANLHSDPRWEPFLSKVGFLEGWQTMPDKYKGVRR
jgi:TolB-like protein/Tfp pilus assembly protein PilF